MEVESFIGLFSVFLVVCLKNLGLCFFFWSLYIRGYEMLLLYFVMRLWNMKRIVIVVTGIIG